MNTVTLRKFYPLQMYVLDNLANQRLSFSNPKNFNDPFDCRLLENKDFYSSLTDIQKKSIENMHVLCTFEVKDKTDLSVFYRTQRYFWSFYGDSHKGICIEFDMPIKENASDKVGIYDFNQTIGIFDEKDVFFSGRAEYKSEYLKNLSTIIKTTKRDSFPEVLKNIGFNKDDVYNLENEFRIINLEKKDNNNYSFFSIENYHKRIIFGNRCNHGVRELVTNALNDKFDSFYFVNDKLEEEEFVG